MTNPDIAPNPESFTPEQLLAEMESTRECFPIVGATTGTDGNTDFVTIARYHASMRDFFDNDKLDRHLKESLLAPTVNLPLQFTPDFRYAFDPGQEWFRVGRGTLLHATRRKVPVRIVTLDFEGFSCSWLCRDERDVEQTVS